MQQANEVLYDDIGTLGGISRLQSEPVLQLYENTQTFQAEQSTAYENVGTSEAATPTAGPKPVVYGELDFSANDSSAATPGLGGPQTTYVTLKQPGRSQQGSSTDSTSPQPGVDEQPENTRRKSLV